jgi:eukaryotic-like serine/threonine-protein kinase
MAVETRVQQLLDELVESDATPEEVCGPCPELLPTVRDRWQKIRRLRHDLDALFPPPDQPTPQLPDATALPQIPGYEVDAVLGRGGMGVVFRARHLRLDRPVAVKMMLAGAYAGPREKARFQREAEAVAKLRHPNIVQIYDVGDVDGRPYFTMELADGGSLAQKLAGTPQPVRQAVALVATLAGAVQAAHACGIVHRDLKPANVLLTADGTPKISDFGLAHRLDGEAGITGTGLALGTPSYMAPEQARGRHDAVGPTVDVYALGAILYELLTGRPPFRAATAAETVQQVISEEPAPPSRLNNQVPRDLETICLKCLHKEPARRYESASALAGDLRRFEEGRPIHARPVGWAERSWRWGRRNPTMAALLLTALALVALASGGGTWLLQQRTQHNIELRSEIGTAVTQAVSLRKGFHFHEARELLDQARLRLGLAGSDDLRGQVEQARADLDLAEHLDVARVRAAMLVGRTTRAGSAKIVRGEYFGGEYDLAEVEPLYASAFAEAGLGRDGDDRETVAARVRQSAVRAEIVAALDDWASITADLPRRTWLLAIARRADPDPALDRLRQPDLWQDRNKLMSLAEELRAELSPQLATTLGRISRESGGDAVVLLTAAQRRFPQDFWLNFELGFALFEAHRFDEALGYYRAALALRPDVGVAHNGVGVTLAWLGRTDDAIEHFQEALRLDPKNAWAHHNLGFVLRRKGLVEEPIDHFQQSIRLDPNNVMPYLVLGEVLSKAGRVDEAIHYYQEAIRVDPNSIMPYIGLGDVLSRAGRVDEAIHYYQEAIRLDPNSALGHHNLGALLLEKGRLDEAIDHFQQVLRIEPKSALASSFLGGTLYAAAQVAVGKAAKKGQLGEPERAGLRRQALDRLRASLEQKTKLLQDGKLVDLSLNTWQTDPALASVRDPAELAKLPDAEREKWQQFWADVAQLIAADPLEQGRAHAAHGEWVKAADGYARALTRGPTDDSHFCFEHAALLLLSGDRAGYAKACAHMVERCGKDGGPRAYHVARACTLAPDAVADAALPERLAAVELRGAAKQFWSLTEQGALAYRARRFQESVPLFEQSLQANSQPGRAVVNWLWLALANHRLGKAEEARRWLGKAQAWLDQFGDGMPDRAEAEVGLHLHNWLEAHVLRREAEALIQSGNP